MDSITHILDSINSFSSLNFIFSSFFEPLKLLLDKKSIPLSISALLNDSDFIFHLSEASRHMDWINSYFDKSINPLVKKELKKFNHSSKNKEIPYADFRVDRPPVFKNKSRNFKQISFDDILASSHISPVKRRADKPFNFEGSCPFCGAPKDYIYDNNGKGQFLCKACKGTFSVKTTVSDEIGIFCPYCSHSLEKHHDRKGYIVYKCPNYKCSYYLKNKEDPSKTSSNQDYLHYHYREFKFDLDSLNSSCIELKSKVNLAKIHFDSRVLGLVLTYFVNYGLSSRKTALILKQVHGISISHQTVKNYADSAASLINDMVSYYPYKLSSTLTGDETYIKVRNKNHYVFFWSDTEKKIITSHTIYPKRDTECACKSIMDCLQHYNGHIPEDLTLIADGNPIYNAAQLFFKINNISFDLHQVIGVKNKDEESKKYRPYKQIEERLNRTYKQNYHGTNGYDTLDGANSYMVLFVAFHNFLRQHSSLHYHVPVDDEHINKKDLMPDQWLQLIELSNSFHLDAQFSSL